MVGSERQLRLGGPIFGASDTPESLVQEHLRLGLSAARCPAIQDAHQLEETLQALGGAGIVIAEVGAYCLNILDTNESIRERNVRLICERLAFADEVGALCCPMHGGSVETGNWGQPNPENLGQAAFDRTVETIQRILDTVRPKRTKLALEPEVWVLPDGPEIYAEIVRAVNRSSFGVHLDPVNMITSPRRYYANAQFLRECFALLGAHIVGCHAKDTRLVRHATVRIDETYAGNGVLDYGVYLAELVRLPTDVPLMVEHVNEQELNQALDFLFAKAHEISIPIRYGEKRDSWRRSHSTSLPLWQPGE